MRNKQTNIWKRLLLFSVLLLFAAPIVLAAPAPSIYMDPKDSNVNCGEGTTVEVRINTSDTSYGAQAYAHFDPTLVNITNVDYTGAAWQPPFGEKGWVHLGNYVTMVTTNFNPGVPAGDHLFATIEIECVGCGCTSDIEFTMVRPDGTCVYNGTVTCTDGEQPPCLGTCCNDSECTELWGEDVTCKDCIAAGKYWHPNEDAACFGDATPSDLCINWCPECSDGGDNDDDDTSTDYPADKECTCGLDPSEAVQLAPIPELPTFILMSIGILGLVMLTQKRD